MNQTEKQLSQAVRENPFPDYQNWWKMGPHFVSFMAEGIVSQWADLAGNDGSLETVSNYCAHYLNAVYAREVQPKLVLDFASKSFRQPIQSGEFDALSYAFYRAAFELIAAHPQAYDQPLAVERRLFTKRVGRSFFTQVHDHLSLNLPDELTDDKSFYRLQSSIVDVGRFLVDEGYLRDHFAFTFQLDVTYNGRIVRQSEETFLNRLHEDGVAYALYEMGYPAILPSAVYLYNTIGEAQHHSSRTIEELFARVGCEARETDDFNPTDHPSDLVVELWEIRKQQGQGAA